MDAVNNEKWQKLSADNKPDKEGKYLVSIVLKEGDLFADYALADWRFKGSEIVLEKADVLDQDSLSAEERLLKAVLGNPVRIKVDADGFYVVHREEIDDDSVHGYSESLECITEDLPEDEYDVYYKLIPEGPEGIPNINKYNEEKKTERERLEAARKDALDKAVGEFGKEGGLLDQQTKREELESYGFDWRDEDMSKEDVAAAVIGCNIMDAFQKLFEAHSAGRVAESVAKDWMYYRGLHDSEMYFRDLKTLIENSVWSLKGTVYEDIPRRIAYHIFPFLMMPRTNTTRNQFVSLMKKDFFEIDSDTAQDTALELRDLTEKIKMWLAYSDLHGTSGPSRQSVKKLVASLEEDILRRDGDLQAVVQVFRDSVR